MATYIVFFNWTEQGIRDYRSSADRVEQFRSTADEAGVQLRDIWWTSGQYDLVAIMEAPNGQTLSGVLLKLGALGNVRTTTTRAFNADEFKAMIA